MSTIEEAREILRIDGNDNDAIIEPLIDAIPRSLKPQRVTPQQTVAIRSLP